MSNRNESKEVKRTSIQDDAVSLEASVVKPVIYVGSSLQRGALQQYSVFKNGIPKSLQADIENCPAIAQLMVPIPKLVETQRNMQVQGSLEYTLNEQIKNYARGGTL